MTRLESKRSTPTPCRAALLALAALLLFACATSGPTAPTKHVESKDGSGFQIMQELRVSARVRSDFEEAIERIDAGEIEEGIVLLESVTHEAPQATAAHIDLGIAYGRVDRWEDAEASMQRALELNPRHPVALNELGIVYRHMGRFDDARASYEQALEIHPEFHYARRNLAILCDMFLGDVVCAIENYELYTQAVPDDEKAAMWIADLRNRHEQQ